MKIPPCLFFIIFSAFFSSATAQKNLLEITTTSSTEYLQKPGSSIYPVYVDGLPYQAWSGKGDSPYFLLKAVNGQTPYTWKVLSGSLPTGLTLSPDGKISGIPASEGKFEFSVEVKDKTGSVAQKVLFIQANPYRAKWFTDARFGIWYSLGPSVRPKLHAKEEIKTYEDRVRNFDADKMAAKVASMGGKILNYSVKGGDGIRMWPSTTPSKHELKTQRNFVKELVTACHKRGIKFVGYFAPDHTWNGKVNDTAPDGSWGTLNAGLVTELVEMGVDGLWVDMGGTPELYPDLVDEKWFPWSNILAAARTLNPDFLFANNPGLGNGGITLRWPDTDILVYEGKTGTGKSSLVTAKPSILKKKVAIEVDNLLDTTWAWIARKEDRKPKSADVIIENIKANWAVGATYMLDIPISPDGNLICAEYEPIIAEIGKFVRSNQQSTRKPFSPLSNQIIYHSAQQIILESADNGKIHYTLNGSTPTTKSPIYTKPLSISKSTRIRAITVQNGKKTGDVFDKKYLIQPGKPVQERKNASARNLKGDNTKFQLDDKGYYRGMRFIVGPDSLRLSRIGRKFVEGNKNVHSVIIKKYPEDYPIFTAEINSLALKVDADGYQYIDIQPMILEPAQTYVISSKENNKDQFAAITMASTKPTLPGIRITGLSILSPTGDRKPVQDDKIGAYISMDYEVVKSKNLRNLALGCYAVMTDNDDKPTVSPFMGIHHAELAVDGKSGTRAQAGGKYAWTLKLDLADTLTNITEVTFDFQSKAFSTDFELYSSSDNVHWKLLLKKNNNSELKHRVKFKPLTARYFKLRSIKPDGPNQKGGGMAVQEFRIF